MTTRAWAKVAGVLALTALGACGGIKEVASNEDASAADDGGAAGASGHAGSVDPCTPGETQTLGTCERCGTTRQTCLPDGTWSEPICEDQKECNPGDFIADCAEPCEARICTAECTFGTECTIKPGAKCLWNTGNTWQCCGVDHWQYCNKDTCDWHPCEACKAGNTNCTGPC